MKRLAAILLILALSGCATLTYKAPDGTEMNYARLLTTSDAISGKVGNATVKVQGQQIDMQVLQAIIQAVIAAGATP